MLQKFPACEGHRKGDEWKRGMKIKVGLEKNDMYSLLRTKISPTGMFEDDFSFPVDILLVPWY